MTLSKSFGTVYYTSPWLSDYPVSTKTELGEGFDAFERVSDIWKIVNDVDLFVFTELHEGNLQEYLVAQGKRVWGSRNGDDLEIYRTDAKPFFDELDIPQAPYEIVTGMDELRKYIKKRGSDKLWIKIDRTRGDTETFSVEGYDLAKNRLDTMEADLGPIAQEHLFVVEDNLPDTFDIAIDTYCINGKFPSQAMLGIEQKDQGYVCVVKDWDAMPPGLLDIYEKLSPILGSYNYRNLLALESRVGKDGIWLADPCCRFGSPVSELEMNLIANLPDIIWEGADGKLVQPKYHAKFGCEVLIRSAWACKNPLLLEFPEEYREQIKLRYAAKFGKETWILPQNSGEEIGTIVAYGNSLDDCMEEIKEIGDQIKGTQVNVASGSMDELKGNLETLGEWGIKF